MSNTQHTPGPWHIEKLDDGSLEIVDSNERTAITSVNDPFEKERNEIEWANARLIAAAPDLLAALQELEIQTQHAESILSEIAEGDEWSCAILAQLRNAGEQARAAIAKATEN